MKNIRTILLLSATCLTIMGAETSFASLNGASLLDYKGASATSTSICNHIIPSPKGNVKSHTHLVAASPSPHLSSSNWPQTQSEHRNSSAPISLAVTDARGGSPLKLPQLASVCFITDAGNCSGIGGAGSEDMPTSSGGPEDWELDSAQRCREEGYVNTICPEGTSSGTPCPYDSNWHSGCICADTYNKSCTGSDQKGKGESCNGLYQECCNLCSDYPYTASNLPAGYVKGASCNSCSGTKYKAQCDSAYKYACTYNYTGHISGGSGTACDGKYKSCKCMSGYTWNASTGTCDISCDTAYKFDCIKSSSTHISGGDGSACNSKYQRCTCTSPYTWSSTDNACTCPTTYKYTCSGTGYSGGSGTACDGKYKKCTCKSGYEWKNGTCQKEALNGAIGNICYCNNAIIGVKTDGMSFFVGLKDIGYLDLVDAEEQSSNYFCSKFSGNLPSKDQLLTIYNQKSSLNTLFLSNSGTRLTDAYYWSSTPTSNPYTNYLVDIASGTVSTMSDIYSSYYNGANVRAVTTCGLATPTCDSSYQYTCTGSNQTGGSGTACDGKYTACTCKSGYEWKDGSCQKEVLNGAQGDLYYCNGTVVGVKIGNTNFYITMKDFGPMNWSSAYTKCMTYYIDCNIGVIFPREQDLKNIYRNKTTLNTQLLQYGGDTLNDKLYWSTSCIDTSCQTHISVNINNGSSIYNTTDNKTYYLRPIFQ